MATQLPLADELEALLFQVGEQRRWIQDSPVLPNVWEAFAARPAGRVDLLITPHRGVRPSRLADRIRRAVDGEAAAASPSDTDHPAIAFNQTLVVARLTFNELIKCVVPMSKWFERHIASRLDEIRAIAHLKSKSGKSRLGGVLRDLEPSKKRPETLPPLVVWWLRLTGYFSLRLEAAAGDAPIAEPPSAEQIWERSLQLLPDARDSQESEARLFRIAMNRRTSVASLESVRTVKVDAALRVFEIDASRICWAVLDSGIDVRHPAFHDDKGRTRVVESYDFTRIRRLIWLASSPGDAASATLHQEFGITPEQARRIRTALTTGGEIDWELLRPALRVNRDDASYFEGLNPHGTHVAGILGGRPQPQEDGDDDFCGVCPDIRLIDIRILDKEGQSKEVDSQGEFDAIAALQFVGHLNSFGNEMVVHGVNLSIQLQHDPRNFACGRTPVCEECNRLVANGLVVVAAAGNMGIDGNAAFANTTEGAFRDISIADPGNAESVITVGSTHRGKPHIYGVSFFSSRGPTGDGRMKPDLVAPGEKVIGPVGADGYEEMQGTSQAAPFVSGAAAILLARNSELIGDPARVKAILCQSATDLGRLREFQGAGLLDVLRALQSV
jgi:hypothetical protein